MDLPDINILVAAYRGDHVHHEAARSWLVGLADGRQAFALAESTLECFLRLVTNPRVFREPDSMDAALGFVETLRRAPRCVLVRPDARHLDRFLTLCRTPGVRANLVPDAWLAALALESGCRLATRDRDFARFEGLDWYDPLGA
jgi:toxin-antitoxin system PIN domain toxin